MLGTCGGFPTSSCSNMPVMWAGIEDAAHTPRTIRTASVLFLTLAPPALAGWQDDAGCHCTRALLAYLAYRSEAAEESYYLQTLGTLS